MTDFDESSTPSLAPKSPQSDDLRTRIAAAVDQAHASTHPHSTYDDWLTFAADAVIRELGLREETCVMANHADHDKRVVYTKVPLHRYVTKWECR